MGVQGKARRGGMVIPFNEEQRRRAPPEPCNPPRGGIPKVVNPRRSTHCSYLMVWSERLAVNHHS